MGAVWREDPPLRTLTGALKVLQQRSYFPEPLVARRRTVGKPLRLPCGAYATTREANAWAEPGTEKVLVGTWLMVTVHVVYGTRRCGSVTAKNLLTGLYNH